MPNLVSPTDEAVKPMHVPACSRASPACQLHRFHKLQSAHVTIELSGINGLVSSDQESQVPNRVNPAGMTSEDN